MRGEKLKSDKQTNKLRFASYQQKIPFIPLCYNAYTVEMSDHGAILRYDKLHAPNTANQASLCY